ncbi:beta-N-acetylhexosaminidase (plasmid) [Hymenobacter sp. NBH84]|uniref:beta-N-acetylhexosaminidase n=1 Tax=Hymenobacter sp. NBH84 TaxID=2596915 RepID=UPI0016267929|nr:beta-N-acetylhexosaminidase [Hymenobacter sp. NBH84]QNE41962.1 beta-N-acetylhexosaminidase [Hymenobacter sp. NBH84]
MRNKCSLLILYLLLGLGFRAQAQQAPIIPQPAGLELKPGSFTLDERTSIQFKRGNKELAALAQYLADHVRDISGYTLPLNKKTPYTIELALGSLPGLGDEGYQLRVSPTGIVVKGNTRAGVFYGLQSLRQTLPPVRTNAPLTVPAMEVVDSPRFAWRGMMLDVSRHFYTVQDIKEILDLLALYKINTFHWHLTDNEGWRLEIKKYPRLTKVGAWRQELPGSVFYKPDSAYVPPLTGRPYPYGGYYTQAQAREVVAYAQARNITVVPEIEMPGHSGAALAAYPRLACMPHPQPVPNATLWSGGMQQDRFNLNYCPANDSVFVFLQDVLSEVMDIFPSQYLHIGGDEVDKDDWKKCAGCQALMQREGLRDEDELQSYFIKRIEKYVVSKGRRIIGWDEILEGGLAPEATVMSWRGEKGGIAAARQGHDVVMSPSNPLYFNRYQAGPEGEPLAGRYSINTLEKVYAYNPLPAALSGPEQRHVLGAQFAIWTEFISSRSHLEYMLLPRLPAFAETLWTPPNKQNFNNFTDRLNQGHFSGWEQQGIRFHPLHYRSRTHEATRQ